MQLKKKYDELISLPEYFPRGGRPRFSTVDYEPKFYHTLVHDKISNKILLFEFFAKDEKAAKKHLSIVLKKDTDTILDFSEVEYVDPYI
jgi:hypothetical protein